MKCEIHALDFAICELMLFLDLLFGVNVKGWMRIGKTGLDVEVLNENKRSVLREIQIRVKSLNWPECSYIYCMFVYEGKEKGWLPNEIRIYAPHIKDTLFGDQVLLLSKTPGSVFCPEVKTAELWRRLEKMQSQTFPASAILYH